MISHHHRSVFVHIPKNAGQSIEHVFLELLELDWTTRAPLLLRPNDTPALGPPRLAHLKAMDYVRFKYLTEEQFRTYFKFSFVRNPWDRAVSLYRHLNRRDTYDFKRFLMSTFKDQLWRDKQWFVGPQADFVCRDDGSIVVDFVGRFENLQTDFDFICKKLGLSQTTLPHMNKSIQVTASGSRWLRRLNPHVSRKDVARPTTFRDYYDSESKEFVAELYAKDIETFGYTFE